jgi:hypothetical protein
MITTSEIINVTARKIFVVFHSVVPLAIAK